MTNPVMAATLERDASPRNVASRPDPKIREIIAAGRGVQARASSLAAWSLAAFTSLLLWASFTPLNWSPLAWVALVPVLLLVRTPIRSRWMYVALYTSSFAGWLATLQWMRLGDPSMYIAWVALAFYVAWYLPAFVALARMAVHRWNVPMTVAVPVLWTGLELFRSHLLTGFSWYFLGHSQYRWTTLIQVSDLVGAYGVSFLVALASAAFAGLLPLGWLGRLGLFLRGADPLVMQAGEPSDLRTTRRQVVSLAAVLAVLAAALVYGMIRRGQAEFTQGPNVALIQGNFTTSLKHDPRAAQEIFNKHHELTGKAVYPYRPDVIVWPETMFRDPLMVASANLSKEQLAKVAPRVPVELWRQSMVPRTLTEMARQAGAALFIGVDTFEARDDGFRHYNSAAFVTPEAGLVGRYDKLHLVPFGEYLPLRNTLPILGAMSPIPAEFSITPGDYARAFAYKDWRFAPLICFEDTVPHLVRGIVAATRVPADPSSGETKTSGKVDCFVNLTNDGWFHGSSELDQHLITAAFRSVECRTPMVRAVNTGISAVIDGDGVIREPEVFLDGDGGGRTTLRDPRTGRWHKQLNAVVVSHVPLDNRTSLYVAGGDWFALLCGGCCLMVALSRWVPVSNGPARADAQPADARPASASA